MYLFLSVPFGEKSVMEASRIVYDDESLSPSILLIAKRIIRMARRIHIGSLPVVSFSNKPFKTVNMWNARWLDCLHSTGYRIMIHMRIEQIEHWNRYDSNLVSSHRSTSGQISFVSWFLFLRALYPIFYANNISYSMWRMIKCRLCLIDPHKSIDSVMWAHWLPHWCKSTLHTIHNTQKCYWICKRIYRERTEVVIPCLLSVSTRHRRRPKWYGNEWIEWRCCRFPWAVFYSYKYSVSIDRYEISQFVFLSNAHAVRLKMNWLKCTAFPVLKCTYFINSSSLFHRDVCLYGGISMNIIQLNRWSCQ